MLIITKECRHGIRIMETIDINDVQYTAYSPENDMIAKSNALTGIRQQVDEYHTKINTPFNTKLKFTWVNNSKNDMAIKLFKENHIPYRYSHFGNLEVMYPGQRIYRNIDFLHLEKDSDQNSVYGIYLTTPSSDYANASDLQQS